MSSKDIILETLNNWTLLNEVNYNTEDLKSHHGVSSIVYDNNKNILLMDHVKFNFWTIPVGKVKPNQTIIDGLKEEMKEELGISVSKFKEIGSFKKTYIRDGKKIIVNSHIFLILDYKGKIKNNEPNKHRSIKFMSIVEIKKLRNISDNTKKALELI